jgi:cytochrome P450
MEFNSADTLQNPYPLYSEWRNGPLWWADDLKGWVVTRYDDVRHILKTHEVFSSTAMAEMQDQAVALPLLSDDPPRHTQLRAIVNTAFTTRTLKNIENDVERLVDELLDNIPIGKPVDIAESFTIPLPVAIIARLMGIPPERGDDFKRWSDALPGTSEATDLEARMPDIIEMATYFQSLIPERRESPGDDLISKVVHAEVEGERLGDEDIVGFTMLLLIAGNETTTNLLANLLDLASHNPDIWEELRAKPELVDAAVEEICRYDSPVQWVLRKALVDTEIQGQRIAAGDPVYAILGASNRDERHYPDADTFRLDREKSSDHHTFGHGIHFCIGAPLGRMEARNAISAMVKKFSAVRPASSGEKERTHSNMLRGFHHLWLEFDA